MKILFASLNSPWPTSNGGHQRTNLLHRALSACGDVELLVLDSPDNFSADEHRVLQDNYGLMGMSRVSMARQPGLLGRCFDPVRYPRLAQLAHHLDGSRSRFVTDPHLLARVQPWLEPLDRFDLIVGRYTRALARVGLVGRNLPTLLDIDDLDSDTYQSRLLATRSPVARAVLGRHASNILARQNQVFEKIDHLWVANPQNLPAIPAGRGSVLPNIPFADPTIPINSTPPEAGNCRVMTIGSYRHRDNVMGINRFIEQVWPAVLERVPQARFAIYGSGLSDADARRWQAAPGVEVVGFIEHVADAYAASAVAVCPVLSGAGTNIKVIEAGAHGRQCIMTRVAARGFDTDEQLRDVLNVAGDEPDMARRIVELLQDEPTNQRQATAFHRAIDAGYSLRQFNRIVADGVEAALARHRLQN